MTRKEAIDTLSKLVQKPGALRIITAECAGKRCNASGHDERQYTLRDPRHFIIHNVVKVRKTSRHGQFRASTAEGDWCEGQPEALLARLQEANKAGAIPASNGR